MRTPVTLRLLDEARRFALRYACDDCVHFVVASASSAADERCAQGYPLGERSARALVVGDELAFCKEFEA